MKKGIIVILLVMFCSIASQAQVSEVKEQIEDSYEYYEDALKKSNMH